MKQDLKLVSAIDACRKAAYKVLDEAYPEQGRMERFVVLTALAKALFSDVFLSVSKDNRDELRSHFIQSVDKFILAEAEKSSIAKKEE